jgi:regulator of protease activity HflC (stomatin/prohibitin superfamily)
MTGSQWREWLDAWARKTAGAAASAFAVLQRRSWGSAARWRRGLLLVAVLVGLGYGAERVLRDPPMESVGPGEVGLRTNRLTGETVLLVEGSILVLPGVHELRRISLREQIFQAGSADIDGRDAPFQSVEGLSFGVDLTVRYALDRTRIAANAARLPENIGAEVVAPRVQGVIYKTFSRYTMREIFSTKRAEIQQAIETELGPLLASEGVSLRAVMLGRIGLPAEYRAGLERLLAEELATEKMRYTLELKEKQVRENELEAEAQKVRREKAAEAAGNEQVIAARAQAEAMKHVLPFKQKQIEQRSLEAQAEKIARVKAAEASAEARRIEAAGEADSRRKIAEAEAYRLEVTGKAQSEQLARDGAVLTQNPLLIQKALADRLSDRISVIIAPPPADGGFIGANLLGGAGRAQPASRGAGGEFQTAGDGADARPR